jgi:hypothetical protein
MYKWANDINRHFSKEGLCMTNEYMEKILIIITHQGQIYQ